MHSVCEQQQVNSISISSIRIQPVLHIPVRPKSLTVCNPVISILSSLGPRDTLTLHRKQKGRGDTQ